MALKRVEWAEEVRESAPGEVTYVPDPFSCPFSCRYDAKSRLTSVSDPDSSYSYTCDDLDRVLTIDNNGTPNMPRVILTLTYDANGNRESVATSTNGSSDFTNNYLYDALNRLEQITQSGTGVNAKRADLTYTQDGQLDTITRYGNLGGTGTATTSDYGHDNADRLTSLIHSRGGTAVASYTWAFDPDGRVSGFTSPDGSVAYSYDANGQLLGADYSAQTDESYSYDANGNRTNSGYSTDGDNRLSSDGTWNHTYDNEGNRLSATKIASGEVILYTWDYRNRLTDITYKTSDTGTITKRMHYTYDVNDLRSGKQVDSNGNGTWDSTERYAYDGSNIVLVFDGSGAVISRYLQSGAMDQTLAEETPGQATRWLLPDDQGTIRDVVDSGTGQTHLSYNSFGRILTTTGSLPAPRFAYTGREWDSDAGLFYYRARWYDAANGRFINQDPVGFTAGDGNLYRYVGNGPVNATDPSGLCKNDEWAKQDAALAKANEIVPRLEFGKGTLADVNSYQQFLINAGLSPRDAQDMAERYRNNYAQNQSMLGSPPDIGSILKPGGILNLLPTDGRIANAVYDFAHGEMNNAVQKVNSAPGMLFDSMFPGLSGALPDSWRSLGLGPVAAPRELGQSDNDYYMSHFLGNIAPDVLPILVTMAENLLPKPAPEPRGFPVEPTPKTETATTTRPGNRGYPDHQADVRGPGRAQAEAQAGPSETVLTEQPVQGHPDINRRADNQVVGTNGKTRLTVESERRPNGPYHRTRVNDLQGVGIEVQTRPLPPRPKPD